MLSIPTTTNLVNHVIAALMLMVGVFFAWRAYKAVTSGVTTNAFYRVQRDSQPLEFFAVSAIRIIAAIAFSLMGVLGLTGVIPGR